MVNVFGLMLPDIPYIIIGAGIALACKLGKFIMERDMPFSENNRRRIPEAIGLILFLAGGLVIEGFVPEMAVPTKILLGFGALFLAFGGLMEWLMPD